MNIFLLARAMTVAYEGTVEGYPDAYIPELWANESVAILEENMVMGNLVHRDFEPLIASYGDVVNTRKPGQLQAFRKTSADAVTVQTPSAVSIPVVLNQHIHTSFLIKDGDQSKSFKDLVVEYLSPAMLAVARAIDLIVLGQTYQFLGNATGQLNLITGSNADISMLNVRQVMNQNKAFVENRNLVLSTVAETALLSDDKFTSAYRVGDDGTALREASLGRKYGFDIFMAQNTPYVNPSFASDSFTGTINLVGGYGYGATSFTVAGFTTAIPAGSWITIAGDSTPLRVISSTGGSTPTAIVTSPGLKYPVANGAVVTVYKPITVNNSGGYGVNEIHSLAFASTLTNPPQVGQLVSFTGTSEVYGIIGIDTTNNLLTLDRPLESAIANSASLFLGPSGSYNPAFHRNAISLITRPLALPMPGTGARAGIANFNNLSMRVVMTYDGNAQGTLVTLDTLMGVKVLDPLLGAVMFG